MFIILSATREDLHYKCTKAKEYYHPSLYLIIVTFHKFALTPLFALLFGWIFISFITNEALKYIMYGDGTHGERMYYIYLPFYSCKDAD
jgi:hypothetical protein